MTKLSRHFIILSFLFLVQYSFAQPLNHKQKFTHEDTLRGSVTPERAWWDVVSYNIYVAPDYNTKTIQGWNQLSFDVNSDGKNRLMQIDLQQPMVIDSIIFNDKEIETYKRTGNVYLIDFGKYNFTVVRTPVKKDKPLT